MDYKLEFRRKKPIAGQLYEEIFRKIQHQELRPGDQLPTVRQLAAELGINFNTVARAYRLLDDAGLISTQQGRGTFVIDQALESDNDPLSAAVDQLEQFLQIESMRFQISPDTLLAELVRRLEQRTSGNAISRRQNPKKVSRKPSVRRRLQEEYT